MTRFLNLTIAGLTIGSIYALVSLGVVVIYRVSRVVNLAHGAMGIFASFVFHYEFNQRLGWPVGLAFAATLAVGCALGVVVERLLVGPVRRDGFLATLVMTVGVLLILTELTVQFWGPDQPVIESIFSDRTVRLGGSDGTGVTFHQLGTLGCVAVLGAAFSLAQGYLSTPGVGDLIVFAALVAVLLASRRDPAAVLEPEQEY